MCINRVISVKMLDHLIPLFTFVVVWSTLFALIIERMLHAVVFCVIGSVIATNDASNALRQNASLEVLKEGISGTLDGTQGLVQSIGTLFVTLVSSYAFILGILLAVFIGASIQLEAAELLSKWISVYNSDVSSSMRSAFLLSLQYSEYFATPLLTLYNGIVYIIKLMGSDVLLPSLIENKEYTLKLIGSVGGFAKTSSLAIVSWVIRLRQSDCSIDRLMNYEQVNNFTVPCFVPGRRALDIIGPMGEIRLIVMYSLLILKNTCQVLTPPLDFIAYPFLDLNFSKALHNFINGIWYWFVNMPLITVQRCAAVTGGDIPLYGDLKWMPFLLCTPDFTPGFSYMIAGFRRLGQLVDNWSNAMWLILLGSLGLPTPSCAPLPLEMRAVAEKTLFGGNETRIVGLTTGAYAITDGSSVQYVFFLGQITKVWSQNAWSGAPSLKHGVAAVTYDTADGGVDANSGQSTLSMMG